MTKVLLALLFGISPILEADDSPKLFNDHPSSPFNAVNAPDAGAPKLEPSLDELLLDPSITLAGDEHYYLTGTWLHGGQKNGIYLWKSPDLENWKALGSIFDNGNQGSRYQAPEVHWFDGRFHLAAVDHWGCFRIMSSKNAEGPYAASDCILENISDPSLFRDDDGSVYLLWGRGYIAPLNDDLDGLAGEPKFIKPGRVAFEDYNYPAGKAWRAGDRVGEGGAFMRKIGGKYHLFANEVVGRMQSPTDDVFVAEADSIYGPYGLRYLAVPHAGQTTIFEAKDGTLYATYSAPVADQYAAVRARPSLVALERSDVRKRLRPSGQVRLEDTVTATRTVVLDAETLRDPSITLGGDGNYYLVGTQDGYGYRMGNGGVRLYRSENLQDWEAVDWIWQWEKIGYEMPETTMLWAPEFKYVKSDDTYYLTFSLWTGTGHSWLFRSTSGKPEGPYANVVDGHFVKGIDGYIFEDEDGKVYFLWGGGRIGELNEKRNGFVNDPVRLQTVENHHVGYEGNALSKINGRYVLSGAEWNGSLRLWGTYDMMYGVSDNLFGPYTKAVVGVPHAGHGTVFKDKKGNWWTTMFGNDMTAPFRLHFGLVPIEISEDMVVKPVMEH